MINDYLSELTAISPIDGRYKDKTKSLIPYFSEYALIKERVKIEILYIIFLSSKKIIRKLTAKEKVILTKIYENFNIEDAEVVKEIEKETRHDVKAVEYFLRNNFEKNSLKDIREFIHFGLTSEDINNICIRMLTQSSCKNILIPQIKELTSVLLERAKEYKNVVIIGRTHGQNAVPTTFGKELSVFKERLNTQIKILSKIELFGKFSGAVGNFNALYFVFPDINWPKKSEEFLRTLGLSYLPLATQVNGNDDLVELFQIIERINLILNDLNQDMWRYVSDTWFIQKNNDGEIGSSTMPQKINPIDFENSEGNIAIANGLIDVFVKKLPISRLQRDLSNSSILRNTGVIFAHCLISYSSTLKGLERIIPNPKLKRYLDKDWSILAEAAQTLLRKEGVSHAYKILSEATKGRVLNQKDWIEIVQKLPISGENKEKLSKLTPGRYRGIY